jgi:GTP diphosphokinase / guanosine-3',5'-bis(diphosphate) 3'-diphosphatase
MTLSVKVDNKVVPLSHVLENGAQVQIITSKNQKPSEDWLKFVVTSKAKTRIRAALKEKQRGLAELGKEIFLRKIKASFEENVDMLARWFGYPNRIEFLMAVYMKAVDLKEVNKRFKVVDGTRLVEIVVADAKSESNTQPVPKAKSSNNNDIIIGGESGSLYQYSLASCCNPVTGDAIFGYISINGLKIHRYACKNANNLLSTHGLRVVKADWGNTGKMEFVTELLVLGTDKGPGVIQALTDRLYNMNINVRSFSIKGDAGSFEGHIGIVVQNKDQINLVIRELRAFDFVSNVFRLDE